MEKTKSSICVETHRNEVILTITQGIDITASIALSVNNAIVLANQILSAARLIETEPPSSDSDKTSKEICNCGRVAQAAIRGGGTRLIGQMTPLGMQYFLECRGAQNNVQSFMFSAGERGIKFCPWCGGLLPMSVSEKENLFALITRAQMKNRGKSESLFEAEGDGEYGQ